jgi:DNA-binding transcriptional LysR family regulator
MDLSHLNLSQLEAFAVTCHLGSYTRAAERLFISQPGLHHKVKQLETELGVPLLVVRDRRVVPTADGTVVLNVAERILGEVRGLEEHFARLGGETTVRAGATMSLAATTLPAPVAAFRAERPDVQVQIVSLEPDGVYDALLSNRVDFAVAYKGYATHDMETEPLIEQEMMCAAAPDHPLVDGCTHRPEELLAYPIGLTEKGMGLRTQVEAWFVETTGVTELPVAFEARTGTLVAQAVASLSSFITFMARPPVMPFRLEEILVDGPRICYPLVICCLPGQRRRRVVEQFLGTLRAWAEGERLSPTLIR